MVKMTFFKMPALMKWAIVWVSSFLTAPTQYTLFSTMQLKAKKSSKFTVNVKQWNLKTFTSEYKSFTINNIKQQSSAV